MTFEEAVKLTRHLGKDAIRPGFQALEAVDRSRVECADTRSLSGSVNIDRSLQPVAPNASRWDYAICYNAGSQVVYWVEVHPASPGDVAEVERKFLWLRNWLKEDGQRLYAFERHFVWIASGRSSFTQGSPQVRRLAQLGVRTVGRLLKIS